MQYAEAKEKLLAVFIGNMFKPVSTIPKGSRVVIGTPSEKDWSHSD